MDGGGRKFQLAIKLTHLHYQPPPDGSLITIGCRMLRADCQTSHAMTNIPNVNVSISMTANAKSAFSCPQYTTPSQEKLVNRGEDLSRSPVPETQNTHVTRTQTACVPIDAIGRRDHMGSRKKSVYVPAVTVVQHPANKRNRTPDRNIGSGALLLYLYWSNNQVASAIAAKLLNNRKT